MKITKTFTSVFLATFLIGYVSVLPTKKTTMPNQSEKEISQRQDFNNSIKEVPKVKDEPKFEPEIFNLPDFSEDDETPKYKMKLMDIIETGNNFEKEEIEGVKSGEIWLGLFEENDGFYLRNTKIKIQSEQRKNYGRKDSLTIRLDRKGESVFLLKDAEKLRKGEVTTLYRSISNDENSDSNTLKRGFVKDFPRSCIYDTIYTLRVKDALTTSNEKALALILESEKPIYKDGKLTTELTSQVLHHIIYSGHGDYVGNLIWVGYLDKDDKPDFYMEFFNYEKGSFSSGLFLSSEAEKGQLVKQVADFGTLGC